MKFKKKNLQSNFSKKKFLMKFRLKLIEMIGPPGVFGAPCSNGRIGSPAIGAAVGAGLAAVGALAEACCGRGGCWWLGGSCSGRCERWACGPSCRGSAGDSCLSTQLLRR